MPAWFDVVCVFTCATQERVLGCWNPAFVHVLKVRTCVMCWQPRDGVVQVDKEASGNVELILGEDDMAAVEEPAASEEEGGAESNGQLEQQLAELREEVLGLKELLLARQ